MKFSLALIVYPIAVLAASISEARQSALDGPFIARLSGGNVFNKAVNASDGHFFTNRPTNTYCPGDPVNCSYYNGNETIFYLGAGTTLGLDSHVPGGQRVYIGPDGALSFTQAHSNYMPPGSIETGFSRQQGIEGVYLNVADREWYICVQPGNDYQVFSLNTTHSNCFEAEIKTYYTPNSGHVWEYV
ncbi:hypothetical protein F4803DRAFT_568443 [Xylaria telfairii]|nr:hypothetical protein F4803DRAFT_568443 [Xylaria telfairii]